LLEFLAFSCGSVEEEIEKSAAVKKIDLWFTVGPGPLNWNGKLLRLLLGRLDGELTSF